MSAQLTHDQIASLVTSGGRLDRVCPPLRACLSALAEGLDAQARRAATDPAHAPEHEAALRLAAHLLRDRLALFLANPRLLRADLHDAIAPAQDAPRAFLIGIPNPDLNALPPGFHLIFTGPSLHGDLAWSRFWTPQDDPEATPRGVW